MHLLEVTKGMCDILRHFCVFLLFNKSKFFTILSSKNVPTESTKHATTKSITLSQTTSLGITFMGLAKLHCWGYPVQMNQNVNFPHLVNIAHLQNPFRWWGWWHAICKWNLQSYTLGNFKYFTEKKWILANAYGKEVVIWLTHNEHSRNMRFCALFNL